MTERDANKAMWYVAGIISGPALAGIITLVVVLTGAVA